MLGCHDEPTRLGTLGANNWIYISMKCVILAGGLGTRLGEETTVRPKPLIEVGGRPIIWHIMKCYSRHGINDFVICLGYKGYMLKEFFSNYFLHLADVTIDIASRSEERRGGKACVSECSSRGSGDNEKQIKK